ncbi:MAG: hypothetical protein GY755_16325 [Chloroflexi bacterium]|nr:hypothetical protein [Chloroflexota bacterium]
MLLEWIYDLTYALLKPFKRFLKPDSFAEKAMISIEKVGKGVVFDCQMCGQCILHSTGMVCSMNCPKNLRNGPCGGVRLNGHCEVKPEQACVWVKIYEGSIASPKYGGEIMWLQPPVNRTLQDTSSWVNLLHGIDQKMKTVWQTQEDKDALEPLFRGSNEKE